MVWSWQLHAMLFLFSGKRAAATLHRLPPPWGSSAKGGDEGIIESIQFGAQYLICNAREELALGWRHSFDLTGKLAKIVLPISG